jgi:hypothetical protein
VSGDPGATDSEERAPAGRAKRMAEAVRLVVTSRERAPRPPRLEHALKRLIWRYNRQCARQGIDKKESANAER